MCYISCYSGKKSISGNLNKFVADLLSQVHIGFYWNLNNINREVVMIMILILYYSNSSLVRTDRGSSWRYVLTSHTS